jgi:hypothetical protein
MLRTAVSVISSDLAPSLSLGSKGAGNGSKFATARCIFRAAMVPPHLIEVHALTAPVHLAGTLKKALIAACASAILIALRSPPRPPARDMRRLRKSDKKYSNPHVQRHTCSSKNSASS